MKELNEIQVLTARESTGQVLNDATGVYAKMVEFSTEGHRFFYGPNRGMLTEWNVAPLVKARIRIHIPGKPLASA